MFEVVRKMSSCHKAPPVPTLCWFRQEKIWLLLVNGSVDGQMLLSGQCWFHAFNRGGDHGGRRGQAKA